MTYFEHLDLSSQLRATALMERDGLIAHILRTTADEIDEAVKALITAPTGHAMTVLNGHWSHGVRMLDTAGKNVHLHRDPA